MNNKNKEEIRLFFITITGIIIAFGFYGLFMSFQSTEKVRFFWEIIMFSFISGTLVLSSNNKYLKKNKYEELVRLGSSFIISGIIILFGIGLKSFENIYNYFNHIGYGLIIVGIFSLSILISSLLFEFIKRIS